MFAFVVRRGMGRRSLYNRRVCYLVTCLFFAAFFLIAGFVFLGINDNSNSYYYNDYQYVYTVCFIYGGIEALCAICMYCAINNMKNDTQTIVIDQNSLNLQRSYQQGPQQMYPQQQYPQYPQQPYRQNTQQQQYQYQQQQSNLPPSQQYRSKPKPAAKVNLPQPMEIDPSPLMENGKPVYYK